MPIQTNLATLIFPDGCKVSCKPYGGSYSDIGAIMGTAKAVLDWKENQVNTANAGLSAKQIKDMTIKGSCNLINIDLDRIKDMAGGIFTKITTPASANSSIPAQIIPAGWVNDTKYELVAYTSGTSQVKLKLSSKPVITSVILNVGSPETLSEIGSGAGGDYMIIPDSDTISGWSIVFNSAGMVAGSPTTYSITVTWGTNTPVSRTTLTAGTSTLQLTPYAIKFEHTDSAGKVRGLEIFSAFSNSGGFDFSFKGAADSGVEELPLSFTGQIDTTLTDGSQLMSFYMDSGAV
jgi:hypothetical protein